MNTDEYEISLAREVTVCKNIIAKISGELSLLEKKHGMITADFIMKAREGGGLDFADSARWLQEYDALQTWQQRLHEYEEALQAVKRR
jgi:hypothetical protein